MRGALTSDNRSSVVLARHSWTTPITRLRIITNPNSASRHSPSAITTPMSVAITALNRVKTLARTISPIVRDERLSVLLTRPVAVRSATSAVLRPRHVVAATSLTLRT